MNWIKQKEAMGREILTLLYEHRMIRTFYRDKPDGWTLVSGLWSPIYIQLRLLVSYPRVLQTVSRAMARMIEEEAPEITRVIGIAMAGIPLATGIALAGCLPAGFTRKMEKVKSLATFREAILSYGEHSMVEGELARGDRIVLVDDLVTRFDSKLVALEQVRHEVEKRGLTNVECSTIAVVLDREQGGMEAAQKEHVRLLSLIPFKTVGLPLLEKVMHATEWSTINQYLNDPDHFQDPDVRMELIKMARKA